MKKLSESDSNYTLIFDPIVDTDGSVRFHDHAKNKDISIGIAVDATEFKYRVQQEFPSIIADLIDLAVAIHASDRLISQNLRQEQTRIGIVLPVRHPELLNADAFQNQLSALLEWATGSRWQFNFERRTNSAHVFEQQPLLSSEKPYVDKVALWSGGLDALAGLYTQLRANNDTTFMLFGTGSSDNVYARQRRVFHALSHSFPSRLNLCRVPIRFSESSQHRKNKISRARGIVFTFLGVAYTYLMGQRVLYLYENGIGAINLPYRKSAVGLDHSRSVHPLTLLRVSQIITTLLGEECKVINPFLFRTKAEMCKALAEEQRVDLPPLTMSCDSPHRRQPVQCGYCSSCILRRQALASSGVKDKTRYIVPHDTRPAGDPSLHLRHMLEQASILKNLLSVSSTANLQWISLTQRFPELDDVVDRLALSENLPSIDIQQNLIRLYQTYVAEWNTVKSDISGDLLSQVSSQQISDECLVAAQ